MKLTGEGMKRLLDGATLRLLNAEGEVVSSHPLAMSGGRPLAAEEESSGRGPVTSCDAIADDGTVLATGTVGLIGSGFDVELDHLDVQKGSRIGVATEHEG